MRKGCGAGRAALFRTPALTFSGDRTYVDRSDGEPLARAVRRTRFPRGIMDFTAPDGAVLLAVGRVPPGFRPYAWAPVSWPAGRRIGVIRPRGFVHCDFELRDPRGGVLAVAERGSRGFRESFLVRDARGGAEFAAVVEPEESVRAMGERGALPSARRLDVELLSDPPPDVHALVLALPLVIRMRHGWDHWQW
ncbi:hypothetical protein [Actinomadura rugatobispora]|uniref:DUF1365 domain-containing protein n=1 Tax=Actinomadura rugatobispora TaxID=1994 RepID=A0ABW0ZXT6_9ACTN|nr:hypothetical protein GCM10010200_111230 [Actinomadura rugatobispora]